MAKPNKKDASGGVNRKPAPRSGKRRLTKPAFEFKLARVREVGGSQKGDSPEGAFEYWSSTVAARSMV